MGATTLRLLAAVFLTCLLCTAGGCVAVYKPVPFEEVGFLDRAETKESEHARVTVAVLTDDESRQAFGVDLAKHNIQPVWIEIENRRDKRSIFMHVTLDPQYYAPREAAHVARHFMSNPVNVQMAEFMGDQGMPIILEPHSTHNGFVFTNLDHGAKFIDIELVSNDYREDFEFMQIIPGLQADYLRVNWANLYPETARVNCDATNLRRQLELLPATATGKGGRGTADPLNLVIISSAFGKAFVSRNWDVTEIVTTGSVWRTVASSVFGAYYRYSPISALYFDGRPQDIAFQKARGTVDERNHLRLWMTPLLLEGRHVWIGQISRDIGVRLAFETFPPITHIIDPDVDEARDYLALDLAKSERVEMIDYVGGVGEVPSDDPRGNLTGDPWFSDGNRIVIVISDERIPMEQIRSVWDD